MEIWKDSHIFGNIYEVSTLGNVRSKTRIVRSGHGAFRTVHGKNLTQQTTDSGYKIVDLKFCGNRKSIVTHRLVAFAFINSIIGKDFINHKDGNKSNNIVSNLEWCTRSENMLHAYNSGLIKPHVRPGENSPRAKLKDNDVISIKIRLKNEERAEHIAKEYGLSRHTIYAIKTGRNWSHISIS